MGRDRESTGRHDEPSGMVIRLPVHGRGAAHDPPNRFESVYVERDEWTDPDDPAPRTRLYRDRSRTVVVRNKSPDVGHELGVNPYRGCEHGCIYCYARPSHEYLGFSAGLDFETKILVKENAPELLRKRLSSKRWKPEPILISGITDPYQPVERRLKITRGCLEVLAECRNPVALITKNHLVTRDIDLLQELAAVDAVLVMLSVTTLDRKLQRLMEPRTSTPTKRLDAIRKLADAGIPTSVSVAPVIPGLTDHEMPAILEAAAEAGATSAGYIMLRLPFGVAPLFEQWLGQHFPDQKQKVLGRVRELRGGALNDPRFRSRMRGEGPIADHVSDLFKVSCTRVGLSRRTLHLNAGAFRPPGSTEQTDLFG